VGRGVEGKAVGRLFVMGMSLGGGDGEMGRWRIGLEEVVGLVEAPFVAPWLVWLVLLVLLVN